jgi:hypothetical protein
VIPLPAAEEVKESPWIGKISLKDVPVLISAEKWKADYLITGDKKDFGGLRATTSLSFKILEPAEFIRSVIPEYLRQFEIKNGDGPIFSRQRFRRKTSSRSQKNNWRKGRESGRD